jgi:ABC-type bacteriocin/lantibiotic exporter with double-glycine peptidase domain
VEELMALYRNGVSDALYAFNKTSEVFVDDIQRDIDAYQVFVLSLACSLFGIVVCFVVFIAIPIFLRVNSLRKKTWEQMMSQIKTKSTAFSMQLLARLSDVHDMETDFGRHRDSKSKNQEFHYHVHRIQKAVGLLIVAMFVVSSGFL